MDFIHYPKLEKAVPDFFCRSSTREGGVSQDAYASMNTGLHVGDDAGKVIQNRRRLFEAWGIDASKVVWMQQVHGAEVAVVNAGHGGAGSERMEASIPQTDAMVCAQAGVFLAVGQADCLAVVAVDPVKRAFGVAHAGWRGAVAKAPLAMVEALVREFGCTPKDLKIAMSPALCQEHLELGQECKQAFTDAFELSEGFLKQTPQGKVHVDLWECSRYQLLGAGCDPDSFDIQNICTFEEKTRFFSYRRGPKQCGRMVTLAGFQA